MSANSQASEHCHNTRGGHKCADVSCPQVSYRLIKMSVKQLLEMKIIYDPKKMLRHNIFGQGYAREAGPASRCKRISRRCRSTDFACLRKPVSDSDLMVIMTQPVVEVVMFL